MSEIKGVQNIYGVVDNELSRMHEILKIALQMNRESDSSSFHRYNPPVSPTIETIYKRIMQFQDIMLEAVRTHDGLVQEKVAELALTGTKENV